MKKIPILIVLVLALAACGGTQDQTSTPAPLSNLTLEITSPSFAAGETIPAQFTCTGDNISPELIWTEPPEGTRTFVLIMDDPDVAGDPWVHWVLYNLPSELRGLGANYTPTPGVTVGTNSWGRQDYGGPCPPVDQQHHYHFKLYALDTVLPSKPSLAKAALLEAMEGQVLAQGELIGVYVKP